MSAIQKIWNEHLDESVMAESVLGLEGHTRGSPGEMNLSLGG